MILAIFDFEVTLMLPIKFHLNWPFGSGEKAKNRFSRWLSRWPFWISNRNTCNFNYFLTTSHSDASFQVLSQMAIQFRRRSKLNFQDGCHLRFLIDMILAILDLQVTPMLPTMFQVNWPFNSEEAKK